MSDKKVVSVYDSLDHVYAEQLKGKSVALTIKSVDAETIVGDGGRTTDGFALSFDETTKRLIVAGATIRRQLALACGTDDPSKMAGQKITLYPVKSTRSVSGQAIRIKIPEVVA